jgi:hypothetical protein
MIHKVVYRRDCNPRWYILWDTESTKAKLRYPTKPLLDMDDYPADYVKQSIEQGYWIIEDSFDLWVREVRKEAGVE